MSYLAHAREGNLGSRRSRQSTSFAGREDEAVRVMKGVLLGCALGLPLWAAIGFALRATLG